jgi:hypothetical protein
MACDLLEFEFIFVLAVVLWLFPFSNKFIVYSRLNTLLIKIYWQIIHSLNIYLPIFLLPNIDTSFLPKITINLLRIAQIYNFFIVNLNISNFDWKWSIWCGINFLENGCHYTRDYTKIIWIELVGGRGTHGVSFTASGLSVSCQNM